MKKVSLLAVFVFFASHVGVYAQDVKFKQLKQEFATPNVYRTASGAPGHAYWQQQADYKINIELDDEAQRISGYETITYTNNSPDELDYLWVQLDQNVRAKDALGRKISTGGLSRPSFGNQNPYAQSQTLQRVSTNQLMQLHSAFDGGFNIEYVKGSKGEDLAVHMNYTMMRIDLDKPLKSKGKLTFSIKWWYNINDRMKDGGGRSGMEYFEENDNYIYTIAQFYPRMAVYNEVEGWQNKQFIGAGEFTLPFGDFDVKITVPADHVLGATGELQNAKEVLSAEQLTRMKQALSSQEPVQIVTQEEAINAEKDKRAVKKTWHFMARNVRDFAFATSRKFMWDAMGVSFGDRTVLAMSYYPKEGNPLWERYSTRVVAHTIETYSKYTFEYPYPVAISAHTNYIGMEYPMICFNGGRPESDGTYSEGTKFGMLGVIIHEVGHNYFPMIVNSDERQWTWMDEGLNTFLQSIAQREWDEEWTNFAGNPRNVTYYMAGEKSSMVPIMTNSESLKQFGMNGYQKPAAALNVLRETVMGPALFDYAFKKYAQRWMFKHPTPEDFFRTMEDASAVDLDWFWRGWFYGTDHVDLAIQDVKHYVAVPISAFDLKDVQKEMNQEAEYIYFKRIREEGFVAKTQADPSLKDFYNDYDPYQVSDRDIRQAEDLLASLSAEEATVISKNNHYYEITISNIGGLVMPIILKMKFDDGSERIDRIPVEIWRRNSDEVSKLFITQKAVVEFEIDPYLETADTDRSNNYAPNRIVPTRFQLYKSTGSGRYNRGGSNPMRESSAR